MKYLVIDGNSIINRAFYGIKLLNAKDGHFTNALFGFMNILIGLDDKYSPDAIITAFDVHQPTFRHRMYSEYKAGRKGAPPELIEQFEPLKVLLKAYGCTVIECPGFEADDILGTLSVSVNNEDHCYIVTGDRDSLQLISDNVTVLLTTTKMGKTQTVEYDKEKLFEEYGVSPSGMIELKALQGDSSDNIPGVAGIGPKTAGELIKKYGTIDKIYEDINAIEASQGVKAKLDAGKDSAYFSRILGTISKEAPIATDMTTYLSASRDSALLLKELARHEMFKLISRLKLENENTEILTTEADTEISSVEFKVAPVKEAEKIITDTSKLYIYPCFSDGEISYIGIVSEDRIIIVENNDMFFGAFIKFLFESGTEKVTVDSKQLFSYCLLNEIDIRNIIFDITLGAYLLDVNSSDYSLKSLALSYNVNLVKPVIKDQYSQDFYDKNMPFCDSITLLKVLAERLMSIIDERNQSSLLRDIEIPLAQVLASMENIGMQVDVNGIKVFSDMLASKIALTEEEIYNLAGEKFNINSPKQLGVILFEKLGIPAKKKTKTGYSTNAEVLEALADDYPIVALILEYRTYMKLKSTYCDGLLRAVQDDSRIRSTFNQTETRTGRLSSLEPNLQNIPVRTQLGREMRKFFVARDGFSIIDADYSQIELRVLAALADDKNMLDAFNLGIDIHSVTASKVFDVALEDVTSELRGKAKAVNFGIVYGIGAFSLAKDIKTTRAEAETFIKSYLNLYSSVKAYMENCISQAKEKGYAETLFGRRRYLPELTSSNGMIRSFGERVARNMPIQGTAADIIKIAMIKVYNRLKTDFPDSHLIMQVHDELIAEAPEKDAEAVRSVINEEMENAVNIAVKLCVESAIGKSWYDAKG